MRTILSLTILLALSLLGPALRAQGAHDANIRFGKVDRPGLIAEYPYSKGITENALRARLEQEGLGKPKSEKGFMLYEQVKWNNLSPTQVDVYVKIDAGKGDKQSTIVLLVSKGYDNYISAASDPELYAKLKVFLDGLTPNIQTGQLIGEIGAQEELLRAAEKAYKSSDEDGNRLVRDKEKLEKQIAENIAEKQRRADALSAAKARLEQMKSQLGK